MSTQVLNNRYELERPVGQGGMASVYRARDLRLGRPVAVKVLHPRYADDQEFVQRFDHEAMSAASLSAHPHIVDVYDVGEHGNIHYIVMELIEGEDLKWVIDREAPMPINRAIALVEQVADGLEYAHRQGFVHRDVKPQNILIDRSGKAHITDFGIAKSHLSTALTQAGMTFGTADYISPEQAQGLDASPQSDIYSLGVVLYEMLTGELPFKGDSPMSVAIQHIQNAPPSPRQRNPTIPRPLESILLHTLSKDPRERPASARQFAMALRDFSTSRSQTTIAAPAGYHQPVPAQPERRPARSQTAQAPTVVNTQLPRRPAPSAPTPVSTYDYADTLPANESMPYPAARQRSAGPPPDMAYAEPAPRQRRSVSGNLITLIFLLVGLGTLWLLATTDVWIEPLRSLLGM
jgi:serine/threonine-protein kinase